MSEEERKTSASDAGSVPTLDFTTLVLSMTESALVMMGVKPDPTTGKVHQSLAEARYHIDMLSLIQQKTKGNLTHDEDRLLDGALYELRLFYVQRTSS